MRDKQGSSLIWVLVVILVILLVFGVTLMAASSRFNGAILQHEEQQAYYTAYSSTTTVSDWIASGSTPGAENTSEVEAFLATVPGPETPDGIEYPLGIASGGSLPREVGECTVSLRYLDEERTKLEISSIALFAGVERVVAITMVREVAEHKYPEPPISPFDPLAPGSVQKEREDELNAIVPDPSPLELGSFYDGSNYVQTDAADITLVANLAANREVKWECFWVNASGVKDTPYPGPDALATTSPGATNSTTDGSQQENVRTFVAPTQTASSGAPLARMTFNPLRATYSGYNTDAANTATSNYNTRLTTLTISHTANKNVYLRLGGDTRSHTRYNALFGIDFNDQQTGTNMKANPYVNYYPNNLVMPVTLTPAKGDYTAAAPQYAGYPGNSLVQHAWYPQKWASCVIYTQKTNNATINSGVNTNLILHPFYNAYDAGSTASRTTTYLDNFFDYWGWGSYVSNPNYGQTRGDVFSAFPGSISEVSGRNKRGMPTLPVYYGENFDLYLLDNVGTTTADQQNPTYRGNMAWIQQGVNVLNAYTYDAENNITGTTGSIYATRGLTIGGTYTRTKANGTKEGVNVDAYFNNFIDTIDPTSHIIEYFAQLRYSTLIYNTDIVLVTPQGTATPRTSAFRPALSYYEVSEQSTSEAAAHLEWRKIQSYYLPQTKIIGGRVYVGAGQTLTIEGGKQLYTNPSGKWAENTLAANATGEYSLYVAPESITVAAGATLVIDPSENVNVDTVIYVEGGTLVIKAGAKIRGNIYCYNDGIVDIRGDFQLDAPAVPAGATPEEATAFDAESGIHILGAPAAGDLHTTGGRLIIPITAPVISGTSNRIHLWGNFVDLVTVGSARGLPFDLEVDSSYLCSQDTGANSGLRGPDGQGRCIHSGTSSFGGWMIGVYYD
ncbi:MAG: hypothetical protein LBS98_07505 [Coriobacteriales bacterium]|jgi:hypothetical protein|nr:hypothetical protein [Coriobacteriales bacterium]